MMKDGHAVDSAIQREGELPKWYTRECPTPEPGDARYLEAFWKLHTERPTAFQGVAPIPWSRIIEYGEHKGFDDENLSVLEHVITAMDAAYIKWWIEEYGPDEE